MKENIGKLENLSNERKLKNKENEYLLHWLKPSIEEASHINSQNEAICYLLKQLADL